MGKATIFVVLAIMLGSNAVLFETKRTSIETDEEQHTRQAQLLAREIARSGHNMALSKARQLQIEYPNTPLEDIVELVNGDQGFISGDYQGGAYEASVYLTSSSSFAVKSVGIFTTNEHEVRSENLDEGILGEDILEVSEPSTLKVTFVESMAGYCSAIFLQRIIPKGNNGHGNNEDGCDMSNPGSQQCDDTDPTVDDENGNGNGNGAWTYLEPELIFAPGNNRDGAAANYETVLQPGTMMNFILAVDADFNCEKRDDDTVDINDSMFSYTRDALKQDIEDLGELIEGNYAMIQESPYEPGVWRIAFEDLKFGKKKRNDVKQNGYGNATWDNANKTYGGSGWTETNADGYWELSDYGHMPDFSDQVIEIELLPTGETAL